MDRPTVGNLHGDDHFVQVARKNWLKKPSPAKFKKETLKKEIWDVLERTDFPVRSLLTLENQQFLERYLWPNYTEEASKFHVLLIAMMVGLKRRENLPVWNLFEANPTHFPSFFQRIESMILESSAGIGVRTTFLLFFINAFQSLDSGLVRKECAPLVSILIWQNLSSDQVREEKLSHHAQLRKTWRAAGKRYDAGDKETKTKLEFDRVWLYSLVVDFLALINRPEDSGWFNPIDFVQQLIGTETIIYCERFLELLIDLVSQLPTRRYVNGLLFDLNLLPCIKLSKLFSEDDAGQLFRELYELLQHYMCFSLDDYLGTQLSRNAAYELHCKSLARLQRTALKNFKSKLTILALSNYALLENRNELREQLESLDDEELAKLCSQLGFRTEYPSEAAIKVDRPFLLEVLFATYEKRPFFQDVVREMSIMPTNKSVFEATLLRNEAYDGTRPLALPKLNLQYLSTGDFLWRSFILYRCEAFFEIRKNVEECLKALRPRLMKPSGDIKFDGFSKMALPISRPSILETLLPKIAESQPASVKAEITLDFSKLNEGLRREWESLKPDDVVFLLAVKPSMKDSNGEIGNGVDEKPHDVRYLRTAEVIQVLDEQGRPLRGHQLAHANGHSRRNPNVRKLHLRLDTSVFRQDSHKEVDGVPEVYAGVNLIMRRRGRENNFKAILESIQQLAQSSVPMPEWLQEVFLGFGDPAGAHYTKVSSSLKRVDYGNTFLDWQHLVESFPGTAIEPAGNSNGSFSPPYVIEKATEAPAPAEPPKRKGRTTRTAAPSSGGTVLKISTYKPINNGPYPMDKPKLNKIRFTPTQVEAITSGTYPGLTVIVGPPGSGKTDVATQIINNIYHNFPNQRTLLVAHSNQALNQLFQKIMALDIDERHLLRLGHGEEDLETDADYSKHGRVESFLDNRNTLLTAVNRLAASVGAPGAHGSSCETASYFDTVYIQPLWTAFQEVLSASKATSQQALDAFPFHIYFSNAPQPLFQDPKNRDSIVEIATGCYRHIQKIFSELADIRPFEILRMARDKANYLLIKEARVIAMTSTHAAMRRQEIANLGFRYDNIVMEEAAQITEIEAFIPLALQNPVEGELKLQRVVLCGDHLQNSPVIQNLAFRQYANLEQSLFQRFVRLGVPTVDLDQQGRARPSIADLYNWRYKQLGNLPVVENSPEYLVGNAGFRFDYQFIDVGPYKGVGESIPSPHFVQNLGEAEYAVAIYQYMRLLGYPAAKISILATYAGQRSLIRDVIQRRCANPVFGNPRIITTVDKYQGEQNDYVILSLTRTSRVGYLRDIRRLTVALSRARLGLYVLGRQEVFESCYELKDFMDRLLKRPTKLQLTLGEMHPTTRNINDDVDATEMEGVEHLGQYVYEMTQAKIQSMKDGGVQPVATREIDMVDVEESSSEEEDEGSDSN